MMNETTTAYDLASAAAEFGVSIDALAELVNRGDLLPCFAAAVDDRAEALFDSVDIRRALETR